MQVGVTSTVFAAVQLTVGLATVYPVLHTTVQVDETLRSESHVEAVLFIWGTVIAVQLAALCPTAAAWAAREVAAGTPTGAARYS